MRQPNPSKDLMADHTLHRLLQLALLVGLIVLSVLTLNMFIFPMLWAAILVYITWPLHMRLAARLPARPNLTAAISTFVLVLGIVTPIVALLLIVQDQALLVMRHAQAVLAGSDIYLPEFVRKLPLVGATLAKSVDMINAHPEIISQTLHKWAQVNLAYGRKFIGYTAYVVGMAIITILIAFFVYRDGRFLLGQIKKSLQLALGHTAEPYFNAAGATVKGVVYGILFTALAQALVAWVGYIVVSWWVDPMPSVLWLTLITFLAAFVPLATPLVWGSLSLWLLSNGYEVPAGALFLWGVFAVSSIDNIIRPIIISATAKVPFLLILFGVLGGIAAFGFIGLFVGPIVLAVCLAVWREWLSQKS